MKRVSVAIGAVLFSAGLFTAFCKPLFAGEVNILYTGETHAMLYTCSCPKEQDGGVARRATLVKQLRLANPNTLLLDTGGYFAGGLMDEYTQNTQLDQERTRINLKAMGLMQYDAVAVGDDEFNFGKDFFLENAANIKAAVLSVNIISENNPADVIAFKPYIIKEVSGTKFGIIGITAKAAQQKAGGLKFSEPQGAVKKAVNELKSQGAADIIILLSHQGEEEDLRLIKAVPGIDILIVGHSRAKEDPAEKVDNTIILRPAWQGRRLGKATLTVKDNKITGYKNEDIRLSDQISDDSDILAALPRCFSDSNCKKEGLVGLCQDAGTLKASCSFSESAKVSLTVITPKECIVCNPEEKISMLKKMFPGLNTSYLYYPEANAEKLVKEFGAQGLPIYLLGREIEKEKAFDSFKDKVEQKGNYFMLKPEIGGLSYFLNRKKVKGQFDMFLSLYDKNAPALLEAIKDFNPNIHFLVAEQNNKFDAAKGNLEIEEDLRCVCVQKYYPRYFWDYMNCRAKNIDSTWWDSCLHKSIDMAKISSCARSQEGVGLLKDNIGLNKELKVMFGPTYFMDNQEIFGIMGVPKKEELKKILRR